MPWAYSCSSPTSFSPPNSRSRCYIIQGLEHGDSIQVPAFFAVLVSLNYVTPFDPDLHSEHGDKLMAEGRAQEALVEYEVLLAMKPHDRAAVHFQLASAYFQLENFDQTRTHLLKALDIAPRYRDAQRLLLKLADARKT